MKINKIKIGLILVLFLMAGLFSCCQKNSLSQIQEEFQEEIKEEQTESEATGAEDSSSMPGKGETLPLEIESSTQMLRVYVSGCVVQPDVYTLSPGSIVKDLIMMAGGMTQEADPDRINLAQELKDGEHIIVFDKAGSIAPALAEEAGTGGEARININTADKNALMSLPGIGESKAEAILAYRREQPFTVIEDIMKIPGIKKNAFEKVKDRIRVQ